MSHQESQASRNVWSSTFYLQQLTNELSDDLHEVRGAEDFKADSVSFLVHALQQGCSQLSSNIEAVAAENRAEIAFINQTTAT